MIPSNRNLGIDLLKCLAALFVMNSHFDIMYGKYSFLGTGGTIGDILFFFCSGYTLFLKPYETSLEGAVRSFPNWYKRRINRIWPGLIMVAFVKYYFFDGDLTLVQAFFYHGYWFIDCIMLYYIVIYLIGTFWKWSYKWIYLFLTVITFLWFFLMDKPEAYSMYHPGSHIKWVPYFMLMLLGAQLGKKSMNNPSNTTLKPWGHLLFFILYTCLYYVILGISVKVKSVAYLQPFSFIPLLPCVYHIYKFACSPFIEGFTRRRYWMIATIGGLCLEIYLVADFFITDQYNNYIPLNIVVAALSSIMAAYFLRCGSRFFSQTFKDTSYDWKAIVRLY